MKLILVAGARPNFMKIAALMHALKGHPTIQTLLVHTGQHYDLTMSAQFFSDLNLPEPDINLEVGSASHAVQTARIMEGFEKVCIEEKPDYVLVVGDVNSTAACTLVAAKLGVKTIHYEAGLRSGDRSMPEEINRLVTDAITDIYITTSVDADDNLIRENVAKDKIFMLGNLMIDSLKANLQKAADVNLAFNLNNQNRKIIVNTDFQSKGYGLLTFHRPSNVDTQEALYHLISVLGNVSRLIPLIFPVHPRTFNKIREYGLDKTTALYPDLYFIEPQGYHKFISLVSNSLFVLTDSGGIQEETTYLNIPCLTIRSTTERPITILEGSNKLIKIDKIESEVQQIMDGKGKCGSIPKYWDGHTADRIVRLLETFEI